MNLTLQPEEARLLKKILTDHLSDLRMEIANTEDLDLRETLKQNEATIKSLIARLDGTTRANA